MPHTGAVIIAMTLLLLAWKTPKGVQMKCKHTSALPCLHTELSKAQLSSSDVPVRTHTVSSSQDPNGKFKRETQVWENQVKSPSICLKAAAAFFSPSSVQPLCTGPPSKAWRKSGHPAAAFEGGAQAKQNSEAHQTHAKGGVRLPTGLLTFKETEIPSYT